MGLDIMVVIGGVIGLFIVLLVVWASLLSSPKPFLGDRKRKSAKIIDIKELSPDTKRFRLSLGSSKTPLGLPVGKHITIEASNPQTGDTWNGRANEEKARLITRKYTPMSPTTTLGFVDLVIKIYRPGTFKMPDGSEITFEDGGKMTSYLDRKRVGDSLDIAGPIGQHEYLGRGRFKKAGGGFHEAKCLGMMAGGSGITPMLQIVQAALDDKGDTTIISLLYANKTENDILCQDILDDLVEKSHGRFKVYYTVDFPPPGWQHKTGFISASMIGDCLPSPSQEPLIVMCGPPPMIKFACNKNLDELGYPQDRRINF